MEIYVQWIALSPIQKSFGGTLTSMRATALISVRTRMFYTSFGYSLVRRMFTEHDVRHPTKRVDHRPNGIAIGKLQASPAARFGPARRVRVQALGQVAHAPRVAAQFGVCNTTHAHKLNIYVCVLTNSQTSQLWYCFVIKPYNFVNEILFILNKLRISLIIVSYTGNYVINFTYALLSIDITSHKYETKTPTTNAIGELCRLLINFFKY